MFLNARRDVHAVAKERYLSARISALADHDVAHMHACAEMWHDSKFAPIPVGSLGDPVLDGEKAVDATRRRRPPRKRPAYDYLISHIGMNFPAIGENRLVDIEEEAGQKVVHP